MEEGGGEEVEEGEGEKQTSSRNNTLTVTLYSHDYTYITCVLCVSAGNKHSLPHSQP